MPSIVIIDDDYATEILAENLRFRGFDARRVSSATDAFSELETIAGADLVILDVIMERPEKSTGSNISGDRTTGITIFSELRARNKDLPVLVLSATQDVDIIDMLADSPNTQFLSKWSTPSIKDIVAKIEECLGIATQRLKPRAFIVHGHDDKAKLELKNFLQNTLGLPEPIILHEEPSLGRTLLEKFESYARQSDLVFVLLTPDDTIAKPTDSNETKRQARQNAILELGYFLGALGRTSGRILLLHKGSIELPSDIAGLIYVDISSGVESAGELIRKELAHVL